MNKQVCAYILSFEYQGKKGCFGVSSLMINDGWSAASAKDRSSFDWRGSAADPGECHHRRALTWPKPSCKLPAYLLAVVAELVDPHQTCFIIWPTHWMIGLLANSSKQLHAMFISLITCRLIKTTELRLNDLAVQTCGIRTLIFKNHDVNYNAVENLWVFVIVTEECHGVRILSVAIITHWIILPSAE